MRVNWSKEANFFPIDKINHISTNLLHHAFSVDESIL